MGWYVFVYRAFPDNRRDEFLRQHRFRYRLVAEVAVLFYDVFGADGVYAEMGQSEGWNENGL